MDGSPVVVAKPPERKSPSPIPKLPINSFSRIENNLGKDLDSNPSLTPLLEVDRSNKPVKKFTTPNINMSTEMTNGETLKSNGSKIMKEVRLDENGGSGVSGPEKSLSNGVSSKTITVPGTNGIVNGYASHTNGIGIGDSPDSDSGDSKEIPGSGLSKSLDSTGLAPLRPTVPKPTISLTPSAQPIGSAPRPSSQDVSRTGSHTVKLKHEASEPRGGGLLKRSHSHPNLAQQVSRGFVKGKSSQFNDMTYIVFFSV